MGTTDDENAAPLGHLSEHFHVILRILGQLHHRLMRLQVRVHQAEQLRGEEFREQQEMAVVLLRNGYDLKLSIRNL